MGIISFLNKRLVSEHRGNNHMVDVDKLRQILGSRAASVSVVTAVDSDGRPRGFTCTDFCSVSAQPLMLLVCVSKQSETLPAIQHSQAFVLNILAAGRDAISNRFASKLEDKFTDARWQPSRHANGSPILVDDAVAYAECVVAQAVEAGDHWVFLARIMDGGVDEELGPLMYFRRAYGAWPRIDPPTDATG